jgi:hypothetical protein
MITAMGTSTALTAARWQAHLHPRDWRGRFITKGAHVRLSGGLIGTIREVRPGRLEGDSAQVQVQVRDGRTGWVPSDRVTIADPPNGGVFLGDGSVGYIGSEVKHTDEPGSDIVKRISRDGGAVTVGKRGDPRSDREVDPSTLTGGHVFEPRDVVRTTPEPGDALGQRLNRQREAVNEDLREMDERRGVGRYTIDDLVKERRAEVLRDIRANPDEDVTVKVPSGGEVWISQDLARDILGLPRRPGAGDRPAPSEPVTTAPTPTPETPRGVESQWPGSIPATAEESRRGEFNRPGMRRSNTGRPTQPFGADGRRIVTGNKVRDRQGREATVVDIDYNALEVILEDANGTRRNEKPARVWVTATGDNRGTTPAPTAAPAADPDRPPPPHPEPPQPTPEGVTYITEQDRVTIGPEIDTGYSKRHQIIHPELGPIGYVEGSPSHRDHYSRPGQRIPTRRESTTSWSANLNSPRREGESHSQHRARTQTRGFNHRSPTAGRREAIRELLNMTARDRRLDVVLRDQDPARPPHTQATARARRRLEGGPAARPPAPAPTPAPSAPPRTITPQQMLDRMTPEETERLRTAAPAERARIVQDVARRIRDEDSQQESTPAAPASETRERARVAVAEAEAASQRAEVENTAAAHEAAAAANQAAVDAMDADGADPNLPSYQHVKTRAESHRHYADQLRVSPLPTTEPAPAADETLEARAARVESTVKDALSRGDDTESQFFDRDSKTWAPERARMHDEIISELYAAAANVPNDRKSILSGGLGGAGKTTVLRGPANVDQSQYLTINADDMKEELAKRGMIPNIEGLSPMESAALIHEESSYLSNLMAMRAYADGKNVIWDITMSSPGSVQKRVDDLRKRGYNLRGIFVSIPVETSVERAMGRWQRGVEAHQRGEGFGGRYVPPSLIRKSGEGARERSRNQDTFNQMRTQFDDWELWDNAGTQPRRITSRAESADAAAPTPSAPAPAPTPTRPPLGERRLSRREALERATPQERRQHERLQAEYDEARYQANAAQARRQQRREGRVMSDREARMHARMQDIEDRQRELHQSIERRVNDEERAAAQPGPAPTPSAPAPAPSAQPAPSAPRLSRPGLSTVLQRAGFRPATSSPSSVRGFPRTSPGYRLTDNRDGTWSVEYDRGIGAGARRPGAREHADAQARGMARSLEEAGYDVDVIESDGQIHRIDVNGTRSANAPTPAPAPATPTPAPTAGSRPGASAADVARLPQAEQRRHAQVTAEIAQLDREISTMRPGAARSRAEARRNGLRAERQMIESQIPDATQGEQPAPTPALTPRAQNLLRMGENRSLRPGRAQDVPAERLEQEYRDTRAAMDATRDRATHTYIGRYLEALREERDRRGTTTPAPTSEPAPAPAPTPEPPVADTPVESAPTPDTPAATGPLSSEGRPLAVGDRIQAGNRTGVIEDIRVGAGRGGSDFVVYTGDDTGRRHTAVTGRVRHTEPAPESAQDEAAPEPEAPAAEAPAAPTPEPAASSVLEYNSESLYGTPPSYAPEEIAALGRYTYSSKDMNGKLREGDESAADPALDSAIAKSVLSSDITVFRGIQRVANFETRQYEPVLTPGEYFVDPGYSSTTLNRERAESFGAYTLEIRVPAGTGAAMGNARETELLLGRGAKYKVVSKEEISSGVHHYVVDYVGNDTDSTDNVPSGADVKPLVPSPEAAPEPETPPAPEPATTPVLQVSEVQTNAVELTPQEAETIENYSNPSYFADLNGFMRGDPVAPEWGDDDVSQVVQDISRMSNVIKRSRLEADTVLYRGADLRGQFGDVSEGTVLHERAFMSTSNDPNRVGPGAPGNTGFGPQRLIIEAPAGAPAFNLGGPEGEVILAPDSRFRVTRVDGTDVYATYEPPATMMNAPALTAPARAPEPETPNAPEAPATPTPTPAPAPAPPPTPTPTPTPTPAAEAERAAEAQLPYRQKPSTPLPVAENLRSEVQFEFYDALEGNESDEFLGAYWDPDRRQLRIHDKRKALDTVDNALEAVDSNLDPRLGGRNLDRETRAMYRTRQRNLRTLRRRIELAPDPAETRQAPESTPEPAAPEPTPPTPTSPAASPTPAGQPGAPVGSDGRPLAVGQTITTNGRTGEITSIRQNTGIIIYRDEEGRNRSSRFERVSQAGGTTSEPGGTPTPANSPAQPAPPTVETVNPSENPRFPGLPRDATPDIATGVQGPNGSIEVDYTTPDGRVGRARLHRGGRWETLTPPTVPNTADPSAPGGVSSDPADFVRWGSRAQDIAGSPGPNLYGSAHLIQNAANRIGAERNFARQMEEMYNRDGGLGDSGFTVKVNSVSARSAAGLGGSIAVNGRIHDANGYDIGEIIRTIRFGNSGKPLEIHNDYLSIKKENQGQGFAKDLYRRQEDWAIKQGVRKITIEANIDIGSYAWARAGYDFTRADHAVNYVSKMLNSAESRLGDDHAVTRHLRRTHQMMIGDLTSMPPSAHGKPPLTSWPTPFDLSRIGYTPGATTWPGKALMLSTKWDAIKYLRPPDTGLIKE